MGGLIGAGWTSMSKASSASDHMGLLGRAGTRPQMVNRVPGSQPIKYNIISHVLPVFQEESREYFIVNSTTLQFPTVLEVSVEIVVTIFMVAIYS